MGVAPTHRLLWAVNKTFKAVDDDCSYLKERILNLVLFVFPCSYIKKMNVQLIQSFATSAKKQEFLAER